MCSMPFESSSSKVVNSRYGPRDRPGHAEVQTLQYVAHELTTVTVTAVTLRRDNPRVTNQRIIVEWTFKARVQHYGTSLDFLGCCTFRYRKPQA